MKEQRIITRVGKVCEATKSHHKSWKLGGATRIITRVGSFVEQESSALEAFFAQEVFWVSKWCVFFASWSCLHSGIVEWVFVLGEFSEGGREGGREGGTRRVRTRRNASVYVGCGVGERGRQCDPSGGACRALHTGVGAAAGDAQDPGQCGFLSNRTITHQNFYNLAPFSWLLASLLGTFLCSSYIVAEGMQSWVRRMRLSSPNSASILKGQQRSCSCHAELTNSSSSIL